MPTVHNIAQGSEERNFLITNLRRLMKKGGLNAANLARETNIPQATIHKILAGKTEDPRASTLKTLSDFFGISIDELLTGVTSPGGLTETAAQSIPVISWKDCIDADNFISNLSATNWEKWVVSEYLSKHAFALPTKTCMSPRFPKNTVLFINPDITDFVA